LKNVMLKLFETGEGTSLLPVVATVLQFSPAELARCRDAVAAREERQAQLLAAAGAGVSSAAGYVSSWLPSLGFRGGSAAQ
jgi:hypothetical protein